MADCKTETVLNGLRKHQKEIPTSLHYDAKGSEIYEEITRLDSYYLFNAERELLEENGMDIANAIVPGSLFLELGCGNASKTTTRLNAIKHVHGRCRYAGIDISESALNEARKNLNELGAGLEPNTLEFIHADFFQGLAQVKRNHPDEILCIAWLGSSVGNLTNENTVHFFKDIISIVGSTCELLVSMDMWKNPETLHSAYCDKQGVNKRFLRNATENALSCIGYPPDEEYASSWIYDVEINQNLKRVEKYFTFQQGLSLDKYQLEIRSWPLLSDFIDINQFYKRLRVRNVLCKCFRAGERILLSFSTKYTVDDIKDIAAGSGCQVACCWGNTSYYTCQLLMPAAHG